MEKMRYSYLYLEILLATQVSALADNFNGDGETDGNDFLL